MIRIGLLGDIGSGKSYVARKFGYPVFNADNEVSKIYRKNKKIFNKLRKILPNYINSYPIKKSEVTAAILKKKSNLKKIVKIVHLEIRKKMNRFVQKHKNKKIVILDIPLLLENKINKKTDILIFIHSNKSDILKRLKKRKNFNFRILKKFRDIQLPLDYKRKKSHFIIKNDFTEKTITKHVNYILSRII
tara:strand:+ start:420 stop:989 length:570 start_codon:yes stop_codon:yes gene_type:complete